MILRIKMAEVSLLSSLYSLICGSRCVKAHHRHVHYSDQSQLRSPVNVACSSFSLTLICNVCCCRARADGELTQQRLARAFHISEQRAPIWRPLNTSEYHLDQLLLNYARALCVDVSDCTIPECARRLGRTSSPDNVLLRETCFFFVLFFSSLCTLCIEWSVILNAFLISAKIYLKKCPP